MRKDLGVHPALFPMPVLIVAAYDEDGTPCAMNAAWGTICDMDKIAHIIDEEHKTTKNIRVSDAFTVSLADREHTAEADFLGIATGNKMPDKFAKSGLSAEKSAFVNAPVIPEFPVTMECELAEIVDTENLHAVVGKIVNVSADEKVLGKDGKVDPSKFGALIFDQFRSGYLVAGEQVGKAWNAGKDLYKEAKEGETL